MSGFLFWLLIIACVVALVVLFFPFKFKIEFEAGEHGAWAHFFFFKKNFWNAEKKWGKAESLDDETEKRETEKPDGAKSEDSEEGEPDDDCMPTFVETSPAPKVEAKPAPEPEKVKTAAEPVKPVAKSTESKSEADKKVEGESATESLAKPSETKSAEKPAATAEMKNAAKSSGAKKEKPEKRKLTDIEFWTILLTPDLDSRAFRYVKHALAALLRLFHLRFHGCYVEGIRGDYKLMGYGAAANGIVKSFPVLCDWDIRMDWCCDKRLRAAGTLLGTANLCRFLGLLLLLLFYAGILLFLFFRRRAHVLKTGELPELGFVRQKILNLITEE